MDEDDKWAVPSYDDDGDHEGDPESASHTPQNLDPDDFGISDVGSWLQKNRHAWTVVPAEDDWPRIRATGLSSKKDWNLNMAIEAAFREFAIDGAPIDVPNRRIVHDTNSTQLLRRVIGHIRSHFGSLKNSNDTTKSSFVDDTIRVALMARLKYLNGGTAEEVLRLLPARSKVLACGFVTPNGTLNSRLAGALLSCGQFYHCSLVQGEDDPLDTLSEPAQDTTTTEPESELAIIKEKQAAEEDQRIQLAQRIAHVQTENSKDVGALRVETVRLNNELGALRMEIVRLNNELGEAAKTQAEHARANTEKIERLTERVLKGEGDVANREFSPTDWVASSQIYSITTPDYDVELEDQNVQAGIENSGAATQNERDGYSSDSSDIMKNIPMEEEEFYDWAREVEGL
ncbi:hypothetical protein ACHAP8_006517 [Fusarium lateritium]